MKLTKDMKSDFDEFLSEEGVISSADLDVLIYADNANEAWDSIIQWHKKHKTPLF